LTASVEEFDAGSRLTLTGVAAGYDASVLGDLARAAPGGVLHVAADDVQLARLAEAVGFFAPDIEILEFPAWDTVPYDRASPHAEIVGRRLETLSRLADEPVRKGRLILTTARAAVQRVPLRETMAGAHLDLVGGATIDPANLISFLERNGYGRAEQVLEPGEYAVRGGIVDIFPSGATDPARLDFFGDTLDTLRAFDPVTQRTSGALERLVLRPISEIRLNEASISQFRTGYRELFGAVTDDPLYEAVSAGRRFVGMEHWLPLFSDGMDTLFAYAPEAAIVFDAGLNESLKAAWDQIDEYYVARKAAEASGLRDGGAPYHPVPPARLYLDDAEWRRYVAIHPTVLLTGLDAAPEDYADAPVRTMHSLPGRPFAEVRTRGFDAVFPEVVAYIAEQRAEGRRVMISALTLGSRDRLAAMLRDHGSASVKTAETWAEVEALPMVTLPVVMVPLERGFRAPGLCVISEQDILGDRLAQPRRKKARKAENFIADASALAEGDLVVHADHGIGRYEGLETVNAGGAPHDCLRLVYADGDKLFVPVENIDVLTRYGSEDAGANLDRLGSPAWQARKARLKERIREIAEQLIKTAAARQVRTAETYVPPEGLYDEFAARFPYTETDDQLKAIEDVLADLSTGRAMDRLVCGDVGFGKTEVAMRAAFVAAMSGVQVAVVVPTTLLARQHYRGFRDRFAGLPLKVEWLSRLVTSKAASQVRAGLADGTVDIVIGTHAVLAKSINFSRLGLLIVDEEQHFGVAHKERLKQLKADVHVLTLSATPIPRTLQMALSGVKELSIIATPPVDRLAVRTFVLPFDPVIVREAILRERFRGGQTFYVCPRIKDIDTVLERLHRMVPDIRVAVAHGQMAARDLEDVMTAFSDGAYDVLVSTNIIESGIDLPNVNTIVIHRADLFGLSQLYQLRGRVGRGKARSYAYLTLPHNRTVSKTAMKRLDVMHSLDSLGAGFTLASHDLDIRGAGNLLGDEQSGHIKEVGIELYQHLLEEAVAAAKDGGVDEAADESWSPQISLGMPVLIPETYVADLGVRLNLYRRIASVATHEEGEQLAAEMIDRFGPLPREVENLMDIVALKGLCLRANVERFDAGPKGGVVAFRNSEFPNPAGLVGYIGQNVATIKIRPDQKLVIMRQWEDADVRLAGARRAMEALVKIAEAAG
jgi:transcription-repair coupling factor (superfamily II helicase)